jgi:hypothetical protein
MSYIGKTPTSVPLTSSDITDSIISLPKLTDGTDGNLISYDASGNPVAVATGTDGQVLTSTGAGSPPVFETLPAGGTNTPAFLAYKNATQGSISGDTATKITYTEELFDTDNNFASSRFTATVAGKYYVFAFVYIGATIDQNNPEIMFYKNGSAISTEFQVPGATKNMSMSSSTIVELDIDDYIEVYAKTYSASSAFASGTSIRFGGYKLIT